MKKGLYYPYETSLKQVIEPTFNSNTRSETESKELEEKNDLPHETLLKQAIEPISNTRIETESKRY